MGESVYKEPLGGLLTTHILLIFVVVGLFTLPIALWRWSMRKLVVTDQAVIHQRGGDSNTIPLNRIDNINVQKRPGGRAGTLFISAGGGVPTEVRVAQAELARRDIQARILRLQRPQPQQYPQVPPPAYPSAPPYPQVH